MRCRLALDGIHQGADGSVRHGSYGLPQGGQWRVGEGDERGVVVSDDRQVTGYGQATGARRWDILTRMALADGTIDAALLVRHERARPAERQSADWIDWQLRKVFGALDRLEQSVDTFADTLDLGTIAVGCALGYMPLRVAELEGLPRWPRLRAWFEAASQRDPFHLTTPVL